MKIATIIATYGDLSWRDLAAERAQASAETLSEYICCVHDEKGTLASARNAAASLAIEDWSPDWLCFLDADDELEPGFFGAMEQAFHSWDEYHYRGTGFRVGACPNALLVPSIGFVDATGRKIPPQIPAWGQPLINLNCAVIGTLIPAKMFEALGGFRDRLADQTPLDSLEDWDLWLRAVKRGAKLVPVRDAVYVAHSTPGGRNRDQSPYEAIRAEHAAGFDWANLSLYKAR